jgi:hypothetical protein
VEGVPMQFKAEWDEKESKIEVFLEFKKQFSYSQRVQHFLAYVRDSSSKNLLRVFPQILVFGPNSRREKIKTVVIDKRKIKNSIFRTRVLIKEERPLSALYEWKRQFGKREGKKEKLLAKGGQCRQQVECPELFERDIRTTEEGNEVFFRNEILKNARGFWTLLSSKGFSEISQLSRSSLMDKMLEFRKMKKDTELMWKIINELE